MIFCISIITNDERAFVLSCKFQKILVCPCFCWCNVGHNGWSKTAFNILRAGFQQRPDRRVKNNGERIAPRQSRKQCSESTKFYERLALVADVVAIDQKVINCSDRFFEFLTNTPLKFGNVVFFQTADLA